MFKVYNRNQATLRQWNEEAHEFRKLQTELGDNMPYKTLGGFRRARRANSQEYQRVRSLKVSEKDGVVDVPSAYNKDVIDSADYIKKYQGIGSKYLARELRKVMRASIKRCDKTTDEKGCILTTTGETVFNFYGKNSTADYGGFDFSKHKPNSLIMTHNHPHSTSFSVNDILTISQNPQIKTIVAAGHDGTVYSLSIENGKRVDRSVEREYNAYMLEFNRNTHLVVDKLAEKYNWRYSKK